VITVHRHSVLLAVVAGGICAAVYAIFPDLWFSRIYMFVSVLPGIAVGYFGLGPRGLLAASGTLPFIALAAWIHLSQSHRFLEPGWYYKVALATVVFVGAMYISAIVREEDHAA
jgi:hypothetical protein